MKIYAPDYYNEFSCIADKCKHSCCIGWEIDIDDYTLELYKGIGGELGKKLSDNIVTDKDGVHSFKLCQGERCPFLNEKGLCQLILEQGEDILCDICNDHPRYRNFYTDTAEIGLGLCCEAAAEIVVARDKKTEAILLSDDGYEEEPLSDDEKELFAFKERAISLIQDRNIPYSERADSLYELRNYNNEELYYILFPLERLDNRWDEVLSSLLKDDNKADDYDIVREQLAVYFIFRHLNAECESYESALAFALFSVNVIIKAAKAFYGSSPTVSQIADIARMYSAEVEYSDCNIQEIMKKLVCT